MHLKLRAASSGSSGEARAEREEEGQKLFPFSSQFCSAFFSFLNTSADAYHVWLPRCNSSTLKNSQHTGIRSSSFIDEITKLPAAAKAFPLAFKLPSLPVHKKVQPIYRHLFNKLLLTWKRKKAEKNPDLMAVKFFDINLLGSTKTMVMKKWKALCFHRTMRCQGHVSVFLWSRYIFLW